MKKTIFASLFLASLSFGTANADCSTAWCGNLTLPQNPPVVAVGDKGDCDSSMCNHEPKAQTLTPAQMKNLVASNDDDGGDNDPCPDCLYQPAVPEIKNLVADGVGCGGCDDSDSKAQTLTPAQMKNLVASGDGEDEGGGVGADLYPETPMLVDGGGICVGCDDLSPPAVQAKQA